MTTDWYAERYQLRRLRERHPTWSLAKVTQTLGRSYSWGKKWIKRFAQADPDDNAVLQGLSRRPHTPPEPLAPEVVQAILTIRDEPPEGLKRTPGPVTIKYYLHREEELQAAGHYLPTSTSTIWKILDAYERIYRPQKEAPTPLTRNGPMAEGQIDFKDVGTVPAEPGGKLMHGVETLNVVDTGTSILVDNQARTDFNAVTVIESLVTTFRRQGLPQRLTFDRDTRFIGSWSADDFPSPMMRLLLNLGVEVNVCPPRQPWKNPYVEGLNRTYQAEGIAFYLPDSLWQVEDMNGDFRFYYNYQRPNQALSCGNQPPRRAFPELPALPQLPAVIDPDAWLASQDGQLFKRRVKANGSGQVGKHPYYLSRSLAKQTVLLQLDAADKQLHLSQEGQILKSMPLKGLYHGPVAFDHSLDDLKAEAYSDWQRYKRTAKRYVRLVN